MSVIAIINGPNLNLLGKREPDVYGSVSFDDYLLTLKEKFPDVEFRCFQSNVEGELVTMIQQVGFDVDGVVLNAAAYTHTSVAIADAVLAVKAPVVEVHISNVFRREEVRHHSLLQAAVVGSVVGFGMKSYELAVRALLDR
ncbi:MAG: type II 3-dehydroquinate dehydratase [Bacteroidales bacterium]|nr:type II 3-dehydroquinate dehydratase [Bacteroidales bacterium]